MLNGHYVKKTFSRIPAEHDISVKLNIWLLIFSPKLGKIAYALLKAYLFILALFNFWGNISDIELVVNMN